jgi:hypothetical protein
LKQYVQANQVISVKAYHLWVCSTI